MADRENLRNELKEQLKEVDWEALRPHSERGALFWVSPEHDLVETAAIIAEDDLEQVQSWLDQGEIRKPSDEEIDRWDSEPARPFLFLIVQPYVLIQNLSN
jgi:hypothetical protein